MNGIVNHLGDIGVDLSADNVFAMNYAQGRFDLFWAGTSGFSEIYVKLFVGGNPNISQPIPFSIATVKITNGSSITQLPSVYRANSNGDVYTFEFDTRNGYVYSFFQGSLSPIFGIWLKSL